MAAGLTIRIVSNAGVPGAKRFTGRKFADPIVTAGAKLWPFCLEAGSGDKPMDVVDYQGEKRSPTLRRFQQ